MLPGALPLSASCFEQLLLPPVPFMQSPSAHIAAQGSRLMSTGAMPAATSQLQLRATPAVARPIASTISVRFGRDSIRPLSARRGRAFPQPLRLHQWRSWSALLSGGCLVVVEGGACRRGGSSDVAPEKGDHLGRVPLGWTDQPADLASVPID